MKSLVVLAVFTWNIYTICVSDLSHPSLAQIFVYHKKHFCPLGNREVQRFLVCLLLLAIYTQSVREQNPILLSWKNCLVQTIPLSVGKQIVAEFRGYLGWLFRLSILTESSCAIDLPYPGLAWIIVWHKPRFCPLGSREVQSTEVSRDVCWYLQYGPNPSNSCMAQNTLLSVGNREA